MIDAILARLETHRLELKDLKKEEGWKDEYIGMKTTCALQRRIEDKLLIIKELETVCQRSQR